MSDKPCSHILYPSCGCVAATPAPKRARKKNNAALHSAATPRWGTDEKTIEACRRVMGSIEFDPCSEAKFNEVVRADEYFSLLERGEDALQRTWKGRTRLVNPPGGLVPEFWRRAIQQTPSKVFQTMWIGFSVEQLAGLADETVHPTDFCICFLRKRIKFTRHDGYSGSPSHSNYVCGINVDPAAFAREFNPLGKVQFGPMVIGPELVEELLRGARS